MHTKSTLQPYSRKGFRNCIQCIQRIPPPFVFRLSLLLEPEYMNTVNTIARVGQNNLPCAGGAEVMSFDPSPCNGAT